MEWGVGDVLIKGVGKMGGWEMMINERELEWVVGFVDEEMGEDRG